jgi:DNA adenine methylase
MSRALPPVIKWPGSKRPVAAQLAACFPTFDRYFEPFVGGGAMLPYPQSARAFASDIMPELIHLWTVIRDTPQLAIDGYSSRWQARQQLGHTVFYEVRERFNRTRDPIDFLFLSRTCVNGLIRFNKDGSFNNSLHHTRPGIAPETFAKVICKWSGAIQNVDFQVADYTDALQPVTQSDFVFLDPPYESTRGRYLAAAFDPDRLYTELDRLNRIGAKWMLTYDGHAGQRAYAVGLPAELYQARIEINTGNSPFTRLMQQSPDRITESVYLNYTPPAPRALSPASPVFSPFSPPPADSHCPTSPLE